MKKVAGLFGTAVIALTFVFSAQAGDPPILLNEVEIDPPVLVGDNCQYVELKGSGTIAANTWFVSINSDPSNFGFLNAAVDLSGQSFGSNGILVLVNTITGTCTNRTFDANANVMTYSNPLTLGKGSEGFYVISTSNTLIPGGDIDTDDNGLIDGSAVGISMTFIDGFELNYNPEEHYSYGPGPNLVETFLGGVPDAATRFPGNTATNNASSWYSGDLAETPEETINYGTSVSSNFPGGGQLTPGAENAAAPQTFAPFDFDGDGRTDVSIFRANPPALLERVALGGSTSQWWLQFSNDSSTLAVTFGNPSDKLVPADFTGDGKADIAFFRPSTGEWYVLRSEDASFYAFPFGTDGDIPAPGDFDGDGTADPAVYRPSSGTWFILRSLDGQVEVSQFGAAEDLPTVADFDGDGKDDIAVYRPSVAEWWQYRSTSGVIAYQFGVPGDRTAVGDYTGDGKADVAFYRSSDSYWYVLRSEDASFFGFPWGIPGGGDIPTPGDYDGDGVTDAAIYRTSEATWYVNGSTSGFYAVTFGNSTDQPLPGSRSAQ